MQYFRLFAVPAAMIIALAARDPARASELTLALADQSGATLTFTQTDAGNWNWTGIQLPNSPDPRVVEEQPRQIMGSNGSDTLGGDWALTDNNDSSVTLEQDAPATGLRLRRVFTVGSAPGFIRIETWIQSAAGETTLRHADLLAVRIDGEAFRETGSAPASFPLFGQTLFCGIEHVSGEAHADGDIAQLAQTPNVAVHGNWQLIATAIVGWPVGTTPSTDPIRAAFLQYLDTVRIKPRDLELHTNTWWTLPLPFSEADVLKDIDALRTGFFDRTGMFFDSYALDLGWSDPHSVWRVSGQRFPNEFHTIAAKLAELHAHLGIWASPGSAYPEGLDNNWLQNQGYETIPNAGRPDKLACFALGNRYQQAFKNSLVDYAQRYGLGHVKLDFMLHSCDVATHGHPTGGESSYAIDAGLADVLDSLRAVNPDIVLEPLCCGYPPSPWWTMHTNYLLGPDGDDLPGGRVPSPDWNESLISARDIAYRARQPEWIMPTQALETFDIIMQSPGEFENMAAMAIGRGRWFISTYLKPAAMAPTDWDFLAAMVRWARENRSYVGNAEQFGGQPENRDAYGFVFHNPEKDLFCVRNPWIEPRTIELPANVPPTEIRDIRSIYPRRSLIARVSANDHPVITVAPYETMILETVAASDDPLPLPNDDPVVNVDSNSVQPYMGGAFRSSEMLRCQWDGVVDIANLSAPQLCILIEGSPQVANAGCSVTINGRNVAVQKSSSEGQFYSAASPSPEHWTWLLIPLTATQQQRFHVIFNVDVQQATISAYVRGTVAAQNDPPPSDRAAFPVYNPEQRAWAKMILPAQECASDGDSSY